MINFIEGLRNLSANQETGLVRHDEKLTATKTMCVLV